MYDNNLQFSKLTRADTGVYDCEVSGGGQFGEARVKLTVEGKDSRNKPHTTKSMIFGDKLSPEFRCCNVHESTCWNLNIMSRSASISARVQDPHVSDDGKTGPAVL